MTESELVFVKLGGSLITEKARPETPRPDVIARLAAEIHQVLQARPGLSLLLGHGSGSFGHWQARRYGTRDGVRGREGWVGYARVAASAARLNGIVTDLLLDAGVPVFVVHPSSSARCRDGVLVYLDREPILRALSEGLIPLVHGDVAWDQVRGGTIVSTEELLAFLAPELHPERILLLGETAGVLGERGKVIRSIQPDTLATVVGNLGGSHGPDVTGGMASKVHLMLDLVERTPGLRVQILTGLEPGLLSRVLLDPHLPVGTWITAC